MNAHLLIMYPAPKDPKAFDRTYHDEHLTYAAARLKGATGVSTRRVVAPPNGTPPYHTISDVSFPTMQALEECASSEEGKEALDHAASISTGGAPVILVVEDE
jgi:uncharacterized protein (TIGR02118 family)